MNHADRIDHFAQRRNRLLNTVHTWLLGAGGLLLLTVTAWAFGGASGILYAVVFGVVSMWMLRNISPRIVLSMYNARQVSPADFPAGFRIVEELARRAGLKIAPKLYVVPSRMMNAFAVGRRDDSAIAITDALARSLSTRELAGVLAHELSHVANEDVKVMAFADMVSRFTSFMSTVGLFSLLLNVLGFAGGYETQVPWPGVLVLLAAPTVGGLLQMALSRTREFGADLGAAMLTGDPDGLAAALTKLEKAQGRIWEGLILPGSRIPDPSILRTHPLTAERVARLMALKAGNGPGVAGAPGPMPPYMPRPSLVPKIPAHPGPSFLARPSSLTGMQPLLATASGIPAGPSDEDLPACDGPLNSPDGNPRVRLMRGGVWW